MEEEHWSCEWLEGGLAFNRSSLHACLIVHHGTGFPLLVKDYRGGEVPAADLLAARQLIIEANQNGGHPACRGCSHLVRRPGKTSEYPFNVVGIAHFAQCNIKCDYCYLQTQDPASFAEGLTPYAILPAIRNLIENRQLAPDAIIDWGGGEPTIYSEFDELLVLLTNHGATHYIHTNGIHIPRPLRDGLLADRIHILCSVDAGTSGTYEKMKQSRAFRQVWRNLAEYIRLGCHVTAKYIMTAANSSDAEVDSFLVWMIDTGVGSLVIDINYDHPEPGERILSALARLKYLAVSKRIHTTCGFTGAKFRPEFGVSRKVDALYHEMCLADLRRFMTSKRHQTGEDAVFVAMQYIEELEHSVAYHREVNATPLLSLLRRKFGFH